MTRVSYCSLPLTIKPVKTPGKRNFLAIPDRLVFHTTYEKFKRLTFDI